MLCACVYRYTQYINEIHDFGTTVYFQLYASFKLLYLKIYPFYIIIKVLIFFE
jgi:hypothetical protein